VKQVGQVNLDSYSHCVIPFFPARYLLRPGAVSGPPSVALLVGAAGTAPADGSNTRGQDDERLRLDH
jgi:hypothetical protein